jgi:hypothetical protein
VAHESVTERRGVVHAHRWASRALLVLGGAAAGTAAAWAISAASASAAPGVVSGEPAAGPDTSVTPLKGIVGLDDATLDASKLVGGAASAAWRSAVCQQDATTWSISPGEAEQTHVLPGWSAQGARDRIGGPLREHGAHRSVDPNVADRVTDVVEHFAHDSVIEPDQHTLGAVEEIARKPQDAGQLINGQLIKKSLVPASDAQDLTKDVWKLLNPGSQGALIRLPGLLVEDGDGPTSVAVQGEAAQAQAAADLQTPTTAEAQLTSNAGRGVDVADKTVDYPPHGDRGDFANLFAPVGLPTAPFNAPTVPGGGSAAGGHFDGPASGAPGRTSVSPDDADAGSVRVGVRRMPPTPGAQPGVTPD